MKILIIRLSAMGDVAMTVPVIKALSEQYKGNEITFITGKAFNPFFTGIKNIKIINPDLKDKYKGLIGLYRLFKSLKKEIDPDIFVDIHDVLRTKILRFFFFFTKINVVKISKGRQEKKALIKRNNKKLLQLKHTVLRYTDTLEKAGFKILLSKDDKQIFLLNSAAKNILKKDSKNVGIAPFAKHFQKQYPINKIEEIIHSLIKKGYNIYIFGGGKIEKEFAENLERNSEEVTSLVGKFNLVHEIAIIDNLDIMITMDSANMHITALTNTKVISIWGATHPYAGFSAFIEEKKSIQIQNNNLNCRPCSVYGNKACYKKTLECMYSISPDEIVKACEDNL